MLSDLACMYCQRPAFAVLNIELNAGRGRWPVCRDSDCVNRALFDGGIRLANAAGLQLVPSAIEVTETLRCEYVSASPWGPTQCVLPRGHEDERHAFSPSETVEAHAIDAADEWVNPVTGHGGDCGCTSCYLSQTQ